MVGPANFFYIGASRIQENEPGCDSFQIWYNTKAILILRILKFGTKNATCTVFLAKAFLYGRMDFISQRCIS